MFKNPRVMILLGIMTFAIYMIVFKKESKSDHQKIKGLWTLNSMAINNNSKWQEWNGGMAGYLLYDGDGNGALHLYTKDFKNFKPEFESFTSTIGDSALKHLTNSYNYMAQYSLDTAKKVIYHTRISHNNPKEFGKTVIRKYSFKVDTLILVPAEEENSSLRLKWVRNSN
jgi:hypothetical protein